MNFTWSDASYYLPEAVILFAAFGAIITDLVFKGRANHGFVLAKVIGGLLIAGTLCIMRPPVGEHMIFGQMMVVDSLSHFFRLMFIGITLVAVLFSYSSREIMGRDRENKGEYYALLMFLCFGMMAMASAVDLVMLMLSIELVSLTSYILAGYARYSLRSSEAAMKYVLWGAVSSGLMLFGMSILYGLTGATGYAEIGAALRDSTGNELALLVSVLFIMAGIGYKISAVPFHFWTPDVYEGAPTPVTAMFAAGPKAAGFALMIRFFYTVFVTEGLVALEWIQWPWILAILAAVTMTWGNLAAMKQENVKRLLAYSSIAHVGYLLMGFVLLSVSGLQAILFYLIIYAIMTLGSFLIVIALNNRLPSEDLSGYRGLGFREPLIGVAMFIFLISLVGLPPTAGFVAKLYLFTAVIEAGMWWLALIAVLNSVISLYYYMRIIRAMYFEKGPEGAGGLGLARMHLALIILLVVPTIVFGLAWGPVKEFADKGMGVLVG
ncbi:NADH-quinone oxidoreductase subunit N [bacterium]|nr:MAG: NADH-quinone oxidoreductase subunit N [bacterium]RKZ16099.1 MAG: NADH-quinone oxidoreductase subunit N [bacterium]